MKIDINGKTFPLEVMKTSEELEMGMMGRESLEGGMLFVLGKGIHKFWMKGCLINLDIIFILNNRITTIYRNCPVEDSHRMTLPMYTGIGDHVIEFPSGTANDWKIGDRVIIYS